MRLEKIVDAYLAVAELVDDPGCPVFCERLDRDTFGNPAAVLLNRLGEVIRKHAVTESDTPRYLTHHERPLVFSQARRRWVLEDFMVYVDTSLIRVEGS